MNKKEIVNIHKRPDGIFEIECFEKPLRTQIAELEQENKQLKEQLAIREKALELACEDTYAYPKKAIQRFIEQAKESMK